MRKFNSITAQYLKVLKLICIPGLEISNKSTNPLHLATYLSKRNDVILLIHAKYIDTGQE